MAENKNKKSGWGGARAGAGRPVQEENAKSYTFRAGGEVGRLIDQQEKRSEFIKDCIRKAMGVDTKHSQAKMVEGDFSRLGDAYRASEVKSREIPFYDMGIVAGYPLGMNNDERAEKVDLLEMLCPDTENSYMIRVKGNSMIDANIHDGDIVVVDTTNRNPTESQVAVCELNGEYTLKRFRKRGDEGWLVPANPEFSEVHVTKDDEFAIWGVVKYVVHEA